MEGSIKMNKLVTTTVESITVDYSDLYGLLGVSENATTKQIRQAYKKLANEHHPDRDGNEDMFKAIKLAYEVLSDPIKRQDYDTLGIFEGIDLDKVKVARGALEARIEAVLDQDNIEYLDIVTIINNDLVDNLEMCKKGIKQLSKRIEKLSKNKKRAKAGIILTVFENKIKKQEESLRAIVHDKELFELCLKIISVAGYEFDKAPQSPHSYTSQSFIDQLNGGMFR